MSLTGVDSLKNLTRIEEVNLIEGKEVTEGRGLL